MLCTTAETPSASKKTGIAAITMRRSHTCACRQDLHCGRVLPSSEHAEASAGRNAPNEHHTPVPTDPSLFEWFSSLNVLYWTCAGSEADSPMPLVKQCRALSGLLDAMASRPDNVADQVCCCDNDYWRPSSFTCQRWLHQTFELLNRCAAAICSTEFRRHCKKKKLPSHVPCCSSTGATHRAVL